MYNVTSTKLLFLAPIAIVGLMSALHATGYLHGEAKKRQGWFWLYFFGTLVSMASVVLSTNLIAFILSWEAMGLFSAGLVGFESETRESKKATWIYLLACHAGAVFLILAGAFSLRPEILISVYYLAFIGFSLKIGFPPFHVWLPDAHPAAPAPASAVMSGAMIPLGFYGLLTWVPCFTAETLASHIAWTMLVFGAIAALGGILFALPQRNIKRLLAFSSVENMGVIALGLSLYFFTSGIIGADRIGQFALFGAAFHVINHALLKGGLFLGAGSVLRMTGTLDMDRLGGLMKKMPWTGTLFTLNALGLSGLPPLNAFIGEFMIYAAAISAIADGILVLPASVVLIALALTGGIATAAYTKTISSVFLGESRGDISKVTETPFRMIFAQLVLFLLSLGVSFYGAFFASRMLNVPLLIVFSLFYFVVAFLVLFRSWLPRGSVHPKQLTWDCGYEKPTSRMAWTGTAFSQPLADTFKNVLQPRVHVVENPDLFPGDAAIVTETDDAGVSRLWGPIFHTFARIFQRAHLLQNGSLHFYVLLMLIAVAALLVWGALS